MLLFQNPGLINLDAATVLGVNAKEIDNPIGQFGTGLKYAIAIVLRLGGSITIYRGLKPYEFKTVKRTIRGEQFNIVTMNGRALGYTDLMGQHWEPWMAYRELWSNCRDEGGTVRVTNEDFTLSKGTTTIAVVCGELERAHLNRHDILLLTEPSFSLNGVDVHQGESKFLFYKGVRVYQLPKPARYTYNLTQKELLTEDRTLLYPFTIRPKFCRAIVQATYLPYLYSILDKRQRKGSGANYFEDTLMLREAQREQPSPQFMEVCENLQGAKALVENATTVFNEYKDTMPGYVSPYIVTLNEVEREVFNDGYNMASAAGMPMIDRDRVAFKTRSDGIAGRGVVSANTGQVVLAHSLIVEGPQAVALALIEAMAARAGGSVARQLSYFLLNKAFEHVPERVDIATPLLEDMPF